MQEAASSVSHGHIPHTSLMVLSLFQISRDFRANEVMFTNCMSHEFIVKSHGLIVRNGTPQIIMDYAGI